MELLDMEIIERFWDTILDFLRFHLHKTGWGARYLGQGIFTPTLYSWHAMQYVS